MIHIDTKHKIWADNQINFWENNEFRIYWRGCLFIPDIPVGEKSVEMFAREIKIQGIENACSILYGSFYCFVYDKKSNVYYAFTDNSRQSSLFYDNKNSLISSSFLHLIKLNHPEIKNMLPTSIVEFILTGFIFSPEVFFKNIRIIEADEIIIFPQENEVRMALREKKLENIFSGLEEPTKPEIFLKEFQKIINSLKNKKISIDLTGGTDTRLLMTIFHSLGLNFETAISGMPDSSDVLISSKVAQEKNLTHFVTHHILNSEVLESELKEIFYLGDGLTNILDIHRLYQFQKDKKEKRIDFSISGSGGELYKDGGWWRAAFIKRNKRKIVDGLVNSGLAGWGLSRAEIPKNIFSERLFELAINYKKNLSKKIYNHFTHNSQQDFYKMADQIFYEYSVRAPRGFNQRLTVTYAPLLEKNIVKLGINIPGKERLFHIFYRKIITSLDPEIAKIKTNRGGSTMSSKIYYIITDILKMFLTNIFQKKTPGTTNPKIYRTVENFTETKNLFKILKNYEIINRKTEPENIDNKYLGRLITLGMLIKYINNINKN
ncbi:MAG: hypothetical protein IMZ60_02385 [Actinobacteria bacterium]|nr:hypothetical protein [Actinomycetota bacterium]